MGDIWGFFLGGGDWMVVNFSQNKCPGKIAHHGRLDPNSGLQVTTASGYELCHPG